MQVHPLQLGVWLSSALVGGLLLTPYRDVTYPVVMVGFFISLGSNFARARGFLRKPVANVGSAAALALLATIAIPLSSWGNAWLAVPMATASLVFVMRNSTVATVFTHTSHLWIDPLLLLGGAAAYVVGNLEAGGWIGWVALAPMLVCAVSLVFVSIIPGFQMRAKAIKDTMPKGTLAPDFELTSQDGEVVRLGDLRGEIVLLVFVRGDWCPGCHIMLRAYQKNRARLAERGVIILAIGPDPRGINLAMVKDLGLGFRVLEDEQLQTARAYGLLGLTSLGTKYKEGFPLPASFLLDREGVIRFTSDPKRVGGVLSPERVFDVLDALA
jgi:peroxiredoxin Q/BCP